MKNNADDSIDCNCKDNDFDVNKYSDDNNNDNGNDNSNILGCGEKLINRFKNKA